MVTRPCSFQRAGKTGQKPSWDSRERFCAQPEFPMQAGHMGQLWQWPRAVGLPLTRLWLTWSRGLATV